MPRGKKKEEETTVHNAGPIEDGEKALEPKGENLPAPQLEEMAQHIMLLRHDKVDQGKIEIGSYLLDNLLQGDLEQLTEKKKDKPVSIEAIAKTPGVNMSASELRACIRVAALERVLEKEEPHLCGLCFNAKAAIAMLKNHEDMLNLAKEADEQDLTVKRIQEKVREKTGKTRTAKDVIRRFERAMQQKILLMEDSDLKGLCEDKEKLLKDFSLDQRTKLRQDAEEKSEVIEEHLNLVNNLMEALDEIDSD